MASIAVRQMSETQRLSSISAATSYQTAQPGTPSRSSSLATLEPTTTHPIPPLPKTEHHVLPPSPPPSVHGNEEITPADSEEPVVDEVPITTSVQLTASADPTVVLRTPVTTPVASTSVLTHTATTLSPIRPSHLSYQESQLQPAPIRAPIRRNTAPGAVSGKASSSRPSKPLPAIDPALDSDILKQAEQIRRERLNKKSKQEALDAASLRGSLDENEPVVGHIIKEGHVNYVLMYNMLTGIRTAVSRCQAKPKRPLTDEDYTARHKYSFDIVGNELTPSAKYDFKFKDYAPWVFRDLREEYFHIDPADYLLSLTSKYILSELGSPGKSGSFFYYSRDYKYIIKTIHHSEHKVLLSILPSYHNHIKTNPHTLISRFYGLHRVKLPRGRKIHFVIMNNLFPPHRDIHETYDLKGSTVGREYPEEKALGNSGAVLKDLNWLNRGKVLEFGREKRALLTEQLRRDSEWLKGINVMDYSLLVGIHNMQKGNKDNLRVNNLKVFQAPSIPMKRKPTQIKSSPTEAIALRRAIRQSAPPQSLSASPTQLLPEPDTYPTRARVGSSGGGADDFIFYRDEGGFRATADFEPTGDGSGDDAAFAHGHGHRAQLSSSDAAEISPAVDGTGPGPHDRGLDTIYYLGIIDILTPYTFKKRVERLWKGVNADIHKISPVPASEYGDRFFAFLTAIMRGGDGGQKFRAD